MANVHLQGPNRSFPPQEQPPFTWRSLEEERIALSHDERLRIEQEKYGVDREIVETPDLISESLKIMEEEIEAIEDKEEYETALFISQDHIESVEFRLAFLRADHFDAVKAAWRMVEYWKRKVELFGCEKAFKPFVTLLHLHEKDYEALIKGGHRMLPHSDQWGRAILFRYSEYFTKDVDSMIRLAWLMVHMAIFDAEFGSEIQKCGIVTLGGRGNIREYPFGSFSETKRYIASLSRDYVSVLPMRSMASHVFPPNSYTLVSLERLLGVTSHHIRQRLSVHNMQNVELNFARLKLCGILKEHVPIELGGTLDYDFSDWVRNALFEELYAARVDCDEDDEWARRVPEIRPLINAVLDWS
mmetsp:Transcript_5606/g.7977  ORF Transcript_5606/g.7977 Transcript_5606/m.7977 type:complete len:358 (+) Transcript_5606:223-1296(+)